MVDVEEEQVRSSIHFALLSVSTVSLLLLRPSPFPRYPRTLSPQNRFVVPMIGLLTLRPQLHSRTEHVCYKLPYLPSLPLPPLRLR